VVMMMNVRKARSAVLAVLAPLAVSALLLSHPLPAAAQATPTDKDECKQDGWEQWKTLVPFFKNQGDCVSYVTHLGTGGDVPAVDPAATPELGSLVLFGSGAAGFAGYAWTRLRAAGPGSRAGGPTAPQAP
jgi:hypothetical protein